MRGGGIFVVSQAGTAGSNVVNSTINANSALVDGGGVFNSSGLLTMQNATISGNAAFRDGGFLGIQFYFYKL